MPGYLRYIIIAAVGCLLFLPFLGQVHLFDWDEINFAECAREMIVSKDYLRAQIDFMPFWEKPPFFIWMQVLAMKLFGVGEYAARLPNALIGLTTLLTLFYIGKRVVNEKMATWWVAIFAASWLPHFYFKTGIIDPTFNFFIFLSFFQVYLLRIARHKWLHAILAGLFLGVAVLTKGPVAILVALLALCAYLVLNRGFNGYKPLHLLVIGIVAVLPVAGWMGLTVAAHGMDYGKWFINEFITYQIRLFRTEDADHGGPFFYHFIVLLVGCFPASVFLFQFGRKKAVGNIATGDFTRWMWILFWVVLILFSIVKTKIVHYSSLCYFPLTYLAALQIQSLEYQSLQLKKWVKSIMYFIGILLAVVITALPVVGINKDKLIPYIADPFAVGNLSANVPWSYAECLWGLLYLAGVIIAITWMGRDLKKGLVMLCVVQVVIIQVTLLHFTPKIEAYSQRAAIEYYKAFKGEDVYVHPLGYKSYANLFYTQKLPATDTNYRHIRIDKEGTAVQPEANEQWLLHGTIDKPSYFICKVQDADNFRTDAMLQETGGSNGFVFFKRKSLKP